MKAIRYLFKADRQDLLDCGRFVPLQIEAEQDQLTLHVSQSELASGLCGLLPAWNEDGEFAEGIPRLRARDYAEGAGVTLFRLGINAQVTFVGLSLPELEAARDAYLRNEGLVGARPRDPLLVHEPDIELTERDEFVAISAIIRRLGLLLLANPFVVDTWTNHRMFHVELSVPTDEPTAISTLLEHLQSPHFTPRLKHVRTHGDRHYLAVEGSTAEVNVRLFARSTVHDSSGRASA